MPSTKVHRSRQKPVDELSRPNRTVIIVRFAITVARASRVTMVVTMVATTVIMVREITTTRMVAIEIAIAIVVVAVAAAAAGCYGVHLHHSRNAKAQMPSVDAGQPANFENWIDQGGGLARVRYRGASWDARIDGQGDLEAGALLYVTHTEGHTLNVSRQRPA